MINVEFNNKCAQVIFDNSLINTEVRIPSYLRTAKIYDFKIPKELEGKLEVQDQVVVETVNGLQVARVVSLKVSSAYATKYVISKVDTAPYFKNQERLKKIETLKAELQERKSKFEEKAIYEMLASKDPKAKELLDTLSELLEE